MQSERDPLIGLEAHAVLIRAGKKAQQNTQAA